MKNRRRLKLSALICALLIGLVWWFFHEPGPWYHGKSIRYWTSQAGHWDPELEATTQEALQAMGQSAVPYLIKTLEQKESSITHKIRSYALSYPFLNVLLPQPNDQQRVQAISALGEIGPPASNAIPALMLAGKAKNTMHLRSRAALMKIRGESVENLIRSLDPNIANEMITYKVDAWVDDVFTIGEFGTNAHAFVPDLCRIMISAKNPIVPSTTAQALGRIHSHPEIAVPALITALQNRKECKYHGLMALGNFGPAARDAVPELRRHLNDPEPIHRCHALMSLCRILPLDEVKPEEIKALLPMLTEKLKDPNPRVRTEAANMLKKIEAASKTQSK